MVEEQKDTQKEFRTFCENMPLGKMMQMMQKRMEQQKGSCCCSEMMSQMMKMGSTWRAKKEEVSGEAKKRLPSNNLEMPWHNLSACLLSKLENQRRN